MPLTKGVLLDHCAQCSKGVITPFLEAFRKTLCWDCWHDYDVERRPETIVEVDRGNNQTR